YMPPEQAEGRIEDMGPRADVYAMGAMLYHLLAGHMPYVSPGARKSNRMILTEVTRFPPPPIADEAKDAPAELVAICEKAMARRIADRYADMTALARDLRAFLEQRVVEAYETGAIAELRKWVQRNKALATTAAAALVAVLALSGWAVVERGKARNEAVRADENATLAGKRADDAEREKK
ncbi:MAG: protein kinase, partial [Planctomycetes bacterium]|nr:protein kinase [Planctomycetota bacterium]